MFYQKRAVSPLSGRKKTDEVHATNVIDATHFFKKGQIKHFISTIFELTSENCLSVFLIGSSIVR